MKNKLTKILVLALMLCLVFSVSAMAAITYTDVYVTTGSELGTGSFKNYIVDKEITLTSDLTMNSYTYYTFNANVIVPEGVTVTTSTQTTVKFYGDGYFELQTGATLVNSSKLYTFSFMYDGELITIPADTSYTAVEGLEKVAETGGSYYTSVTNAIYAAEIGATVKLLCDVNENIDIDEGIDVVLDLAGFTLSRAESSYSYYATINNNGTLEIIDSSTEKTGQVVNNLNGGYIIRNGTISTCVANLTLSGGTYTRSVAEGESEYTSGSGIRNAMSGSTLVINEGATITQVDDLSTYPLYANSGTVIINGGTFITDQVNVYIYDADVVINDGDFDSVSFNVYIHASGSGTLKINGGDYDAENYCVYNAKATTITGGDFYASAIYPIYNVAELTIEGGTFTANSTKNIAIFNSSTLGTGTVSGGYFNAIAPIYSSGDGDNTLSVTGGTYAGVNYSSYLEPFIAEGYTSTVNDGIYVVIKSDPNDINLDGIVDLSDVQYILQIATGAITASADVNNDGYTNSLDAYAIYATIN